MAFQPHSTPPGSTSPVPYRHGLTLLLTLFLLTAAQATAAVELTEKTAIEAALKNNPVLRQAEAEVQTAKARLWEGVSVFLPQISANGHYNRLSASQFPSDIPGLSGAFSPSMTSDRYYDAAWTIKQPLFTWGANLSRFAQANADYRLASEKFRQQREETVFQARELYYKALLASAAVLIARESLEVSLHRQRFTQEQETRGKTSRYEVSRADVAVTNDRVAVSRAEKDLKRSLSNLRSFIQSREDSAVTGTIPSTPREYTPAQVLPQAQEHSPKILQARSALESARAEWRGAVSGWLPNVFAAYSRTWQRPEADSRLWDIRWQAQVGVEWNVFNGLNQTAAWQRADGHVQGAEAALQAARAALELEVESAFSDYQQAAESLQLQAANVALAEKNRLIAEEKFSLGMLSPLELQNVQLEHAQTHWNYQQALFDHALAAAALDRLSGATDKE